MSRETERLAREMVRCDVMARRAADVYAWTEVDTWLETRAALRAERSEVLRREIATGAWWSVEPVESDLFG